MTDLVATVTGSHHYIVDYLVDEVLDRQTSETRLFLLRTSILAELTGPLCDAVTGRQDGAAMLADLERANLLLMPLDEERRWYRYHRLFQECLRGRLNEEEPGNVPDLNRRASRWYERQGLVDKAIEHLLAAGDFDDASRLVENHAPRLLEQGQIVALLNRIDRLPEELVRARPRLGMLRGWALALGGQAAAAESCLKCAEKAIESAPPADSDALRGQIAAVRATVASQRADAPYVVEHASQAVYRLPRSEPFVRSLAAYNLGEARLLTGEVALASTALADAAELSLQTGSLHLFTVSSANLARAELLRGRLRQAERVSEDALRVVTAASQNPERSVPALGILYAYLGHVRRESDDLDGAGRFLTKALDLARQSEFVETVASACWASAQLRLTRADALSALALVETAIEAVQEAGLTVLRRFLFAERADILVELGRLSEAETWAREHRVGEETKLGLLRERETLSVARLRFALGELDEVVKLLKALGVEAESAGRFGVAIEILALQALALQGSGELGPALDSLQRALVLAEPEGYVRVFADRGEPLGALLRQVSAHGRTPEYVTRLLMAIRKSADRAATSTSLPDRRSLSTIASHLTRVPLGPRPVAPVSVAPIVEALTSREVEVLRLVAIGASNRRIAEELTVSVGTVKAHVSHILGKLGAHSRTEGIARARELGLLER